MSEKVLIADDDVSISRLLEKVLRSNNMEPTIANNGAEALELIFSHTYDAILMDVMLGDMEGFEVIRKIREKGISTPVMIVSGRNEDYDSLYGLSIGADDYITKPFRPLVLGAKVKALIRRSRQLSADKTEQITSGSFSYNAATMRFYKNGDELDLSSKESAILLLFIRHPQQVFTKEMIYEQVWGDTIIVDDNTIMVYINRLRKKVEEDHRNPKHIVTVRGLGYRFMP
jgi:DNA-binding response OmpR family regulator